MNNIDILEELEEVHIVDGFVISNCLYHEIAEYIESLIAENKELKEKNKELENRLQEIELQILESDF